MTIWGYGEVLLRFTPPNHSLLEETNSFSCYVGGAELNTLSSLSYWGHSTKMLTAIPNNEVGSLALKTMKSRGVDTEYVENDFNRMGIYYLEEGFENRSGSIVYDRRNSSFSNSGFQKLDTITITEGDYFIFTGITLAVNKTARANIVEYLKALKDKGIKIAFDINYRESLWTVDEAVSIIEKVLPYIDVLMFGRKDATDLLKVNSHEDSIKKCAETIQEKYNIPIVASSNRSVENETLQGLIMKKGSKPVMSNSYKYYTLNRIGAGDAFLAGVLHGIINNWDTQDLIEYATKCSAIQHTTQGDALLISEKKISNLTQYAGGLNR
ncbi:sugar kinase [Staphylococcus sp. EZ-P03]|uniref:sugar kinase n=1 Tax=Staphylococcus sp. EZ-P03 TaxID=2282739 RepID=UPI000DF746CF|nr:sugar kinase [Staphylococcus sp. EZ-P03]